MPVSNKKQEFEQRKRIKLFTDILALLTNQTVRWLLSACVPIRFCLEAPGAGDGALYAPSNSHPTPCPTELKKKTWIGLNNRRPRILNIRLEKGQRSSEWTAISRPLNHVDKLFVWTIKWDVNFRTPLCRFLNQKAIATWEREVVANVGEKCEQSARVWRQARVRQDFFVCLFVFLIYLRIPQQGSNPDRGGLLNSYKRTW